MKKNILISSLLLIGLVFSCSSAPLNNKNRFFSEKTFNLVQKAVFEVIVEKPVDDQIIYDRELNWDSVPYSIRNDKFQPLGTAFAISNTELISAFHVFTSNMLNKYFIRDFQGNVYEVDQIKGGCNEKDFIVFTVKGKTFNDYFQFDNKIKTGSPVFSVGNALGEGIIIRSGFLLGTVPEEDSGRWNLLKSSADGSPGNSGGPLITPEGKVVALITSRKDNILYSTPADVILNYNQSFLSYRIKKNYSHILVANKINNVFEMKASLPASFSEITNSILSDYQKHFDKTLTELFNNAPKYLTGKKNAYLFNASFPVKFLSYSHVDPDDGNWKAKNLYNLDYDLEDDGQLLHDFEFSWSSSDDYNYYKINKPHSTSLEEINTNPRYIMDLILRNIKTERTLWGSKYFDDNSDNYRILSYGDPISSGNFQDTLGRKWITAYWNINYDDNVLIMYILPMPNGPVVITAEHPKSLVFEQEIKIQKLCGHIFLTYQASFSEWTEFLKLKNYIPAFFDDLNFDWDRTKQSFTLQCGYLSINSDKNIFNWTDESKLFLFPYWYKNNNNLEFGIRTLFLYCDPYGDDSITLRRKVKPDPVLGTATMKEWNDLVVEKHPYNGKAVMSKSDNTGSIGSIIKTQIPDTVFSLNFSIEDPKSEEDLNQRFDAFKQGLIISE